MKNVRLSWIAACAEPTAHLSCIDTYSIPQEAMMFFTISVHKHPPQNDSYKINEQI